MSTKERWGDIAGFDSCRAFAHVARLCVFQARSHAMPQQHVRPSAAGRVSAGPCPRNNGPGVDRRFWGRCSSASISPGAEIDPVTKRDADRLKSDAVEEIFAASMASPEAVTVSRDGGKPGDAVGRG